jgi:Rrf2 family iron-sulfur cluster assembly transcriptional regulator
MRLTTKGRYAVTAMLDLAVHDRDNPIALADISERQCISLSYLEQLFAKLRKSGLVISTRGPGGGYSLSKGAEDIAVAEVIAAVDETVDATRCGGQRNCQGESRCLTHDLWEELSRQIRSFLSQVSLADVIERHGARQVAERQDAVQLQRRDNIPGLNI